MEQDQQKRIKRMCYQQQRDENQERRMGVDLLKWWTAAGCGGLHPSLCVNKPVIPIRVTHAKTDKFPQGSF